MERSKAKNQSRGQIQNPLRKSADGEDGSDVGFDRLSLLVVRLIDGESGKGCNGAERESRVQQGPTSNNVQKTQKRRNVLGCNFSAAGVQVQRQEARSGGRSCLLCDGPGHDKRDVVCSVKMPKRIKSEASAAQPLKLAGLLQSKGAACRLGRGSGLGRNPGRVDSRTGR